MIDSRLEALKREHLSDPADEAARRAFYQQMRRLGHPKVGETFTEAELLELFQAEALELPTELRDGKLYRGSAGELLLLAVASSFVRKGEDGETWLYCPPVEKTISGPLLEGLSDRAAFLFVAGHPRGYFEFLGRRPLTARSEEPQQPGESFYLSFQLYLTDEQIERIERIERC